MIGDACVTLEELGDLLDAYSVADDHSAGAQALHQEWEAEVDRIYAVRNQPLPSQGELIGAVNDLGDRDAVMVRRLQPARRPAQAVAHALHPKQYHLEYGYSCMGYEIAGGLGVMMADPDREVYVIVGDGSYLMLSSEIVTSIQEGRKLTIVLMDNHGYKSIGSLSRSLGQSGFGTRFAFPGEITLPSDEAGEQLEYLPVDLAANARSLGAEVIECAAYDDFVAALAQAKRNTRTTVIYVQNDRYIGVPGYESWWDVPVAEVSESDSVNAAREEWEEMRAKERFFL